MSKGWKTQSGFIWAVLGSVVGFANILSFSAQCYKNGGGAFLIPYFIAYLIMGFPLLLLEGIIGQKMNLPLVSAYGKAIGRMGKFFGWLAILGCLTIGAFYIVLTSYSLLYTYFSAKTAIPSDTAFFFKHTFLQSTSEITNWGNFSWTIFVATLLVGIFAWRTLTKDISKGLEKICSLMMPLLSLFVIFFAVAATFLPGATLGIVKFLTPDFSKLSSPALWRDIFGQLFFSLSLGLGIIIGYAKYNGDSINLKRSMFLVAMGDFIISFISGWVVFCCVGYMSHLTGIPFSEMIKSDSAFEIGFVIFPKILQTFSPYLQPFLGIVFFLSVFIAGITGVFSIAESIAGNFEREFMLSRKKSVTLSISLICLLATFFCMGNGQHIIGALAPMVLGLNMILSTLLEIIVFFYISKYLAQDPIWKNRQSYSFSYYSLRYFVPIILFIIFVSSALMEFKSKNLPQIIRWSWLALVTICSLCFIAKKSTHVLEAKDV